MSKNDVVDSTQQSLFPDDPASVFLADVCDRVSMRKYSSNFMHES